MQELGSEVYMIGIVKKKKGAGVTDIMKMPPRPAIYAFRGWFNVRDKRDGITENNLKVLNLVTKKLLRDKENGGGAGLEKIMKEK